MATRIWIGLQGGTCSGKSTLARALVDILEPGAAQVICLDRFYHNMDRRSGEAAPTLHNFDHPAAIDWTLAERACRDLNAGTPTMIPSYDYVTGQRGPGGLVHPSDCIVVEGLWLHRDPFLADLFSVLVFVDAPAELRLVRRLRRDVLGQARGWDLRDLLSYYLQCERHGHVTFVEPGRAASDLVANGEGDARSEAARILHKVGLADGGEQASTSARRLRE
jgi:uridine kinase